MNGDLGSISGYLRRIQADIRRHFLIICIRIHYQVEPVWRRTPTKIGKLPHHPAGLQKTKPPVSGDFASE